MGSSRGRAIAIGVALILAIVAIYAQVARFELVHYDDHNYVARNEHVQAGLSVAGARWAATASHAENWHPLTWLSHMIDSELFGDWAGGHHLTSVWLHAANAVLLFALFRSATRQDGPSAFVAAVFAVHPLHVESVAWVAERKDVLSTLFGLLALWSWIAWARHGGSVRYVAALLLFACSLASKPMLVTLPFVLLLLDHWPLERLRRRADLLPRLVEKLPFLTLSAISCWITLRVQEPAGASAESLPLSLQLGNAAVAYVRYLGKALWTADLAVLYPHPYFAGGTPLASWQIASAVALLAAVSALVFFSRRPWASVGWAWYLGTLVPVVGLVQVGQQAIADRYTYVPLVGPSILVAWGGAELARRGVAARKLVAGVALAVLAAFGAVAYRQTAYWSDTITLLSHSLEVAPEPPTIHYILGNALGDQDRYDEAMRHWARAVEIFPGYVRAHNNLGGALLRQGRLDEAIAHFERAVELDPGYGKARENLARARQRRATTR